MSILCILFGHKSREGDHSGGEYMRVRIGPTDGIGRIHCSLEADCPRCGVKYIAGQIHLPKGKP